MPLHHVSYMRKYHTRGGLRPSMKQRGVFLIGLILVGVYFFLFPRTSRSEYILFPEKFTPFKSAGAGSDASDNVELALQSGNSAIFVDKNLNAVFVHSSEKMAVDDHWLADSGSYGLEIKDRENRILSRSAAEGYPVARNGNLFLYDGAGILRKIRPSNGEVLWRREYLSPLTVLDAVGERTLIGLLDGRAEIITDSGEIILSYRPGGSGIEAVYGGALSSDGSMVALVAGVDPQRFVLLQERKNGFRPVTHHDTGTDFRRAVRVGFVRGDQEVLYESENSVSSVDCDDFSIDKLMMEGDAEAWSDGAEGGELLLLGKNLDGSALKILTRENLTMYNGSLPNDTVGIRQNGERTFIIRPESFGVLKAAIQ